MIDLQIIPTSQDWNNKTAKDFYPDDCFNIFFDKSYQDIVKIFQKNNCKILADELYLIPIKPFVFYTACIISGILNKEIPINTHYSEFLLDNIIWYIGFKNEQIESMLFYDLIPFLEDLEIKLLNNDIENSYILDELDEVRSDLRLLIAGLNNSFNSTTLN